MGGRGWWLAEGRGDVRCVRRQDKWACTDLGKGGTKGVGWESQWVTGPVSVGIGQGAWTDYVANWRVEPVGGGGGGWATDWGMKSVGGCDSAEMRRPAIRSTADIWIWALPVALVSRLLVEFLLLLFDFVHNGSQKKGNGWCISSCSQEIEKRGSSVP